ncbi:MAG: hypothetical protein ACP5LD_13860 [Desulfomonilaceae bacterium]
MNARWASESLLGPAAAVLILYSGLVVATSGDIGFDADDWWIFSWAYWFPYPESVLAYARELLRPLEGVYWLSMFELVGFNRLVFHIASLLLWVGAAILMGACLALAFPRDRKFVITSVFLIFFLPMASSLTYIIFTDNARLSILLFWLSALYFLKWSTGALEWKGLFVPALIYVLSFLTYETASLLIFAVPLLAAAARKNSGANPFDRGFIAKLTCGVALALGGSLAIRFTLLSGGAVAHRHLIPPLDLIASYTALLPHYLLAPFLMRPASWSAVVGVLVALLFWACVRTQSSQAPLDDKRQGYSGLDSASYKAIVGLTLFFLGMVPYQIAGYGGASPKISETVLAMYGFLPQGDISWFNFNWASRIYSSASCGVAMVIAAAVSAPKSPRLKAIFQGAVILAIGFMAAFHFGLSKDWQEAAEIRNELVRSLLRQAPDVQSHTNFVFLDLETYHKRAAVVRRWAGLRELIRMLYDDKTLGAWYLYPYAEIPPNKRFQQAIVSPGGFVSRGLALDTPMPHDTLLLLKRIGRRLVLVDKITSTDGAVHTGISWRGSSMLRCNKNRIVEAGGMLMRQKYHCRHKRWINSLVSTLGLDNQRDESGSQN